MFTTLEIILIIALAYLLIGNIITLILTKREGIADASDIAITTFLWLGVPLIVLYNKLKNIIK